MIVLDRAFKRDPWYKRLAARCEFKVLHDRERLQDPYMTRYTVFKRRWLAVYLHRIHRGDDSPEYHDHPWPFFHVLLEGDYTEGFIDRLGRDRVFFRPAGHFAFHRASYAHRLTLHAGPDGAPREVWTLVVTGPRVRNWGFVGRLTRCWVPWERYVFAKERCE